jgi:hypothetical protein
MIEPGVNSWVTLEEADAYFATLLNTGAWTEAGEESPPLQEPALITAHGRLSQETFSKAIDADDPPENLKRAQMKLALAMLDDDMLADTGLEGFESLKVGPISMVLRSRVAGALPADVRRELGGLLMGSPYQFRILRGS